MKSRVWVSIFLLLQAGLLIACSGGGGNSSDSARNSGAETLAQTGVALEKTAQVTGDPVRGREVLLGGAYMQCGVPYKVARIPEVSKVLAAQWGNPDILTPLPGRTGNGSRTSPTSCLDASSMQITGKRGSYGRA